jgi:hypothetical protein
LKINADGKTEFERFDNTMKKLLSVSHEEIKQKLDAEKRDRKRKKAKASASRAANDKD